MWCFCHMSHKYCQIGAQSDVTYPRFTGGNISPGGWRTFSGVTWWTTALTATPVALGTFCILRLWCVQTDCRCGGWQLRLVWNILPIAPQKRSDPPSSPRGGNASKLHQIFRRSKPLLLNHEWRCLFVNLRASVFARFYCWWLKAGHHKGERWV